ncbi:MAG TPA: helix-turn-helix domain-containing protein, partial [Gemmatimonadales bacterium]
PARAPCQARSRASLDRLLTAVELVIAERGVADLTVQGVARRAGLAAGTLYTRFDGKDALLRAFTVAFFARARRAADQLFDDARWRNMSSRALVGATVRVVVKSYRAKRSLLRALYLYVRSHPDAEFRTEAAAFNSEFVRRLTDLLLRHRAVMRHPAPERGVLLGLLLVDAAAKETILFGDGRPSDLLVSDEELAETLTALYCDLLGIPEATS